MVFRDMDSKACRTNCYGSKGEFIVHEWDMQRRGLFKKGIIQVYKDESLYWCRVGTWSVGCWSPGEKDKARRTIRTAFLTMKGLAEGMSFKDCAKVMQFLS